MAAGDDDSSGDESTGVPLTCSQRDFSTSVANQQAPEVIEEGEISDEIGGVPGDEVERGEINEGTRLHESEDDVKQKSTEQRKSKYEQLLDTFRENPLFAKLIIIILLMGLIFIFFIGFGLVHANSCHTKPTGITTAVPPTEIDELIPGCSIERRNVSLTARVYKKKVLVDFQLKILGEIPSDMEVYTSKQKSVEESECEHTKTLFTLKQDGSVPLHFTYKYDGNKTWSSSDTFKDIECLEQIVIVLYFEDQHQAYTCTPL